MGSIQVGAIAFKATLGVVAFCTTKTDIFETFIIINAFSIRPLGVTFVTVTLEATGGVDTVAITTEIGDDVTFGHIDTWKTRISWTEAGCTQALEFAGRSRFVTLAELATDFRELQAVIDWFD